MTKKDYELIASVFAETDNEFHSIATLCYRLADKLEEENPRFEWHRFVRACGMIDEEAEKELERRA